MGKLEKKTNIIPFVPTGGNNEKFRGGSTALGLLEKLAEQEGAPTARNLKVKQGSGIGLLHSLFADLMDYYGKRNDKSETAISYSMPLMYSKYFLYTSKDIELFSLELGRYQHMKTFRGNIGYFLSALINGSKEKSFAIHARHLDAPMSHIGYENTKNVAFEGDTLWACNEMKKGIFVIEGDAYNLGSFLKGGKIVVKGSAPKQQGLGYNKVGFAQKGGQIIIEKDCYAKIREEADGGTVKVLGKIGSYY